MHRALSLQTVSAPLMVDGYQAHYESAPAEFWQTFSTGLESMYQQLHAAAGEAARLIAAGASAPVTIGSLIGLDSFVAKNPAHELATQLRGIRREIGLLRWVCTVRNKAEQHRHENGYFGNRGIVMVDGFALARKPLGEAPEMVRKARNLLRGFVRRYGIALDPESGETEIITYLDFVSHSLYSLSPGEFDRARAVVAEAERHDLIVSLAFLTNVDQALASLIALVPESADSPFAAASG